MESVFISVKDIVPPPPSQSELDSCGSTKSSGEDESDSSSIGSHIVPSGLKRSEEVKYTTCDSPVYENLYHSDTNLVSYTFPMGTLYGKCPRFLNVSLYTGADVSLGTNRPVS